MMREKTSTDVTEGLTSEPTMGELTDRQRRMLEFIETEIAERGYPPTIREIGKSLGLKSTNGVNDHLNALQRKGFIKREDHKSRTLSVLITSRHSRTEQSLPEQSRTERDGDDALFQVPSGGLHDVDDDMIDVPLLGRVAAGAPLLAVENREDTVRVSSFFLGRGTKQEKVFALRVVGESMIEDGIFDGDFLFVKKQTTARPGEIVVAMIEGEATVKRFFPEGDRIRFQPANARMEPIFVSKRDFRQTDILGLVVGVYRRV